MMPAEPISQTTGPEIMIEDRKSEPAKAKSMDGENQKSGPSTFRRWLPVAIIILALGAGYALGLQKYFSFDALSENREALQGFVAQNLLLAAAAYFAVYVIAVSVSFPGASFLTMAGGFMFGWFLAGVLTAFAATLGAVIIFSIASTSIGDLLAERAGPRLNKLREGFQADSFNYLLVLRLAPVVPFWITNLAPALFGMRVAPYALATFLGILPGTFAYTYVGQSLETSLKDGKLVTPELVAALAVLAVVALIPVVVKKVRQSRQQS